MSASFPGLPRRYASRNDAGATSSFPIGVYSRWREIAYRGDHSDCHPGQAGKACAEPGSKVTAIEDTRSRLCAGFGLLGRDDNLGVPHDTILAENHAPFEPYSMSACIKCYFAPATIYPSHLKMPPDVIARRVATRQPRERSGHLEVRSVYTHHT